MAQLPQAAPEARTGPAARALAVRKDAATSLLLEDHLRIKKLFKQFAQARMAGSTALKKQLAQQTCAELRIHTQIEEEIFYPAVRRASGDPDMVFEAVVEHASASALINQLEGMRADDPMFDARVSVLSEYVLHHIKQEEAEMFPAARKALGAELDAIGQQLAARKAELMQQAGIALEPHVHHRTH